MTALRVSRPIGQGLTGIGRVSRVGGAITCLATNWRRARGRVVVRPIISRTVFRTAALPLVCPGLAAIARLTMTAILHAVLAQAATSAVDAVRFSEALVNAAVPGPNC